MIRNISLQIQSVLYKNEPSAVERSLEAIANAVRVTKLRNFCYLKVLLHYGDASPTVLFAPEALDSVCSRYREELEIRYTFFDENTGTAAGHNRLCESAAADYIMIINPDIIVNPLIFIQMLSPFFDSQIKVGITEARQTPIEHSKEYDNNTGETSWVSTACALFPAEVYREVGGFDSKSFFMYCDDLDFSWRVRLAGYKNIYLPNAPIYHAKSLKPDGSWDASTAEIYYSAEAALIMAHKWSNPKRVKELLAVFNNLDDTSFEKKAAAEYLRREQAGELPEPIDPTHTVADFTAQGYGKYRFLL